jgi:predicted negative regulator of RcsB-dependent stress response
VEKMPDDPVVLEHLGDAWSKLGKKAMALECWTKALERSDDPDKLRRKIQDNS